MPHCFVYYGSNTFHCIIEYCLIEQSSHQINKNFVTVLMNSINESLAGSLSFKVSQ